MKGLSTAEQILPYRANVVSIRTEQIRRNGHVVKSHWVDNFYRVLWRFRVFILAPVKKSLWRECLNACVIEKDYQLMNKYYTIGQRCFDKNGSDQPKWSYGKIPLGGQLVQGLMAFSRFHFMVRRETLCDRKMKRMKVFHFVTVYRMK